MHGVKEIKYEILSCGGWYHEVFRQELTSKDPAPLKIKKMPHNEKNCIDCIYTRQERKDSVSRQSIIASLKEK